MMLSYLTYWREMLIAGMAVVIALMGMAVYAKDASIARTENERDQYKTALAYQNDTLLRDGERYAARMAQLPKEITKIRTRYEVIYQDIENWKGDTNESDCDNAAAFLRGFNY